MSKRVKSDQVCHGANVNRQMRINRKKYTLTDEVVLTDEEINKIIRKKKAITSGEYALTENEITLLFKQIDELRTKLLITLAISTGIRRADIVAIQRKDITQNQITFYERKKQAIHSVPISLELYNLCQMYMKSSRKSKYLFPSDYQVRRNNDKHLHDRSAWNLLNRFLVLAGISKRPFHALRSTCVKQAQRKGWSINQVMKLTNDSFRTIKEHYDTPTMGEMTDVANTNPIV